MTRTGALLGKEAEGRVAAMLAARGLVVLGTNVRVGRDELDVVALEGDTLVVVEVRARDPRSGVHPLETLTAAKVKRLKRAGLRLMAERGAIELRVDVAAVRGDEVEIVTNAVDFTST